MSGSEILDITRAALWVTIIISTPVLTIALIVGVAIGLFQALTSVQELTLTFVPKLAAIGATYWLSMSFMTYTLVNFFQDRLIPLIGGG